MNIYTIFKLKSVLQVVITTCLMQLERFCIYMTFCTFVIFLAASLYGTGSMPMFLSLAIKFVRFVL